MKPIIEEIYNTVLGENADSELNSIITRLCDGSGNINIMLPSLQAFFVATCSLRIKAPIVVRLNVEREHYRLVAKDLLAFMGENVFLFPDYKKETAAVSGFVSKSKQTFDGSYRALALSQVGVYLINDAVSKYKVSDKKIDDEWLEIAVGQKINPNKLLELFISWGYEVVDHCVATSMVSMRGGIFDFFPTHSKEPLRIEFFSDTIESIRYFDLETQRSTNKRDAVKIQKPLVLTKGGKSKSLGLLIEERCKNKLYITPRLVGPSLDGVQDITLFYEPLVFKEMGTALFQKKVKEISKNLSSLFLFNDAKNKFLDSPFNRLTADLSSGFTIPSFDLACLVVPTRKKPGASNSSKKEGLAISSLSELGWGDRLVHQDFGVGVYRGLSLVGDKENQEENIKIEYADGGVVYVPVGRFNRVHRYVGVNESLPNLSKLGTGAWERQKELAKKSASEVVEHLVAIHAARSSPRGFEYLKENSLFDQLEESFPYEETPDQITAIDDIYKDLSQKNPMDRLVYGDVGFGKTEVALRAAIRVIVSGRAVFFLTPTTILSDQHYITCLNRLGALGVEVELLSRFKNKKEQRLILERLHQNKIDLLIGTHRILGADVPTENLGLLIVDEEHRFGVKDKETIRKLKKRVDVLTLTATPIPRTLQQSLVGIRDTSRIETPPTDRLPIETFVQHFDWAPIKEVLHAELRRGGQAYFLHNNIEQIPFYLEKLQALFPKSTIAVAHGRVSSRELEKTILSFFSGEIDILLCTTIIESGLDVQNANTIIINEAQNLGLAQLYQIRGRVGRGKKQAFCYLCIPKKLSLMPEAFQRLRAIEHHTALGSGYGVAMKDLEIRGAGSLFGYKQSGQISRIGFELYNKILSEVLNKKQGEVLVEEKEKPVIVFSGSAFIDDLYMPLVQDRLAFYQKISNALEVKELYKIKEELLDRFGVFGKNIENLFLLTETQCLLFSHPVSKCLVSSTSVVFIFDAETKSLDPEQFLKALREAAKHQSSPFQIVPDKSGTLKISFKTTSLDLASGLALNFSKKFSVIVSNVSL